MKSSFFILLTFTFFCLACGNDPKIDEQTKKETTMEEPLPTTPEAVVRLYQKYLDNNKFELAKRLSTPKEQERLNMLSEIISGDLLDSTLLKTVFIKLDCKEDAITAICTGVYKEDDEEYEDEFKLTKIDGQWLVDVTEEEVFFETQEVVNDSIVE